MLLQFFSIVLMQPCSKLLFDELSYFLHHISMFISLQSVNNRLQPYLVSQLVTKKNTNRRGQGVPGIRWPGHYSQWISYEEEGGTSFYFKRRWALGVIGAEEYIKKSGAVLYSCRGMNVKQISLLDKFSIMKLYSGSKV